MLYPVAPGVASQEIVIEKSLSASSSTSEGGAGVWLCAAAGRKAATRSANTKPAAAKLRRPPFFLEPILVTLNLAIAPRAIQDSRIVAARAAARRGRINEQ
jgi:hypothetical protein